MQHLHVRFCLKFFKTESPTKSKISRHWHPPSGDTYIKVLPWDRIHQLRWAESECDTSQSHDIVQLCRGWGTTDFTHQSEQNRTTNRPCPTNLPPSDYIHCINDWLVSWLEFKKNLNMKCQVNLVCLWLLYGFLQVLVSKLVERFFKLLLIYQFLCTYL